MRRGFAIIALLVVIFGGIGIGVGAYRAGERTGITEGIEQVHHIRELDAITSTHHLRRGESPATGEGGQSGEQGPLRCR